MNVVDAVGGIDINVPKRVPTPGNPQGSKHPVPEYIEKGQQHLDGTLEYTWTKNWSKSKDVYQYTKHEAHFGISYNF